jgi:hypothetical protein
MAQQAQLVLMAQQARRAQLAQQAQVLLTATR